MGFGCIRAFLGVEKTGFTPFSRQELPREFLKSADPAGSSFLVRRKTRRGGPLFLSRPTSKKRPGRVPGLRDCCNRSLSRVTVFEFVDLRFSLLLGILH
jgi:hypothetical protein